MHVEDVNEFKPLVIVGVGFLMVKEFREKKRKLGEVEKRRDFWELKKRRKRVVL